MCSAFVLIVNCNMLLNTTAPANSEESDIQHDGTSSTTSSDIVERMSEFDEGEEKVLINETVMPYRGNRSLKKRITVFSISMLCIFVEYLYFTIPMSFLTNEILEVCNFSMKLFCRSTAT